LGKQIITKSIGKRLRESRLAAGISQEELARQLKISRSRYSDIENGKKSISVDELYRFADFYGRSIEFFFKSEEHQKEEPFRVLCRAVSRNMDLSKTISKFERLCTNLAQLEKILNIEPEIETQDYHYTLTSAQYYARYYAERERKLLGLGEEPVKNLAEILTERRGIKIFVLPLPKEISGMFTYSHSIGGCILINQRHHSGRQLFSLAHEYGHFLFHKKKMAFVDYLNAKPNRDERFVDLFAAEFLMPESAVKKMFYSCVGRNKTISPGDVLQICDYFGTSFEATLNRLRNSKLITEKAREKLLSKTWVSKTRELFNIPEPPKMEEKLPNYYKILCLKAFLKNEITVAKLADLLGIPLYKTMELAQKLTSGEVM